MQEARRNEGLTFEFSIPQGMTAEDIARVLTVYLARHESLPRIFLSWEPFVGEFRSQAPPYRNPRFPPQWQLDDENDFWLVEIPDEKRVQLSCRYTAQTDICEAMARLFIARHY